MFHLIFGLPCAYVLVRTLAPLPWPLPFKLLAALLLVAASQYHLWSRLSSGSVFAPEFPRALIMGFNWLFGAILLLALFQVAMDVVGLVLRLARGHGPVVADAFRYGAAALALVLAAIGVHNATRLPEPVEVAVEIPNLPPEFEGYRILQLTDLHATRLFPDWWIQAVVSRANALRPDLIAVTGDLIDGSLEARRADVEPLRALAAPDGVWVVPGNHEYFFGYETWMAHFTGLGMRPLANAHTVLRRGAGALVLAGVTDLSAPETGHPGPDLGAALDGAPADGPVVLLDHQPRNAREAAARGVALQLSGHTHGGMILGLDRVFALANNGFVSGRYPLGDTLLYVSNGTALWPGFALRLGRPAELTQIVLRAASLRNVASQAR